MHLEQTLLELVVDGPEFVIGIGGVFSPLAPPVKVAQPCIAFGAVPCGATQATFGVKFVESTAGVSAFVLIDKIQHFPFTCAT